MKITFQSKPSKIQNINKLIEFSNLRPTIYFSLSLKEQLKYIYNDAVKVPMRPLIITGGKCERNKKYRRCPDNIFLFLFCSRFKHAKWNFQ